MEYLFLLLVLVPIFFYLGDRKGWNATAKRLTTIVRANIESSKPVKALEPVKEFDAWEEQFKAIENPPSAAPAVKPSRHKIIKTDYYKTTSYGLWPRWHCKCGASAYEPLGGETIERAQRRAQKAAEYHVIDGDKTDALLEKTKGAFAW